MIPIDNKQKICTITSFPQNTLELGLSSIFITPPKNHTHSPENHVGPANNYIFIAANFLPHFASCYSSSLSDQEFSSFLRMDGA